MQKSKLPSLITILVITLITVIMWIGFTIYRAFATPTEASVPPEISATLNPSLDTNTITKIESGLYFNASQIPQLTFSATPSPLATTLPKPVAITTPVASASATPTETPIETPQPSPTP